MSYQKTTWVDHITDPITGEVIQQGTKFTAARANHMEDGIEQAHQLVESLAQSVVGNAVISGLTFSSNGLTADYTAGMAFVNGVKLDVAAGSISLNPNQGQYIYLDADGVVKSTTSQGTAEGKCLLWYFETDGSGVITTTDRRTVVNSSMFVKNSEVALNGANKIPRLDEQGKGAFSITGEAASVADGSVTDAKIGNRTIDQTVAPANTGLLSTLLGGIANMIKAITGKSDWKMTPRTTLENAVRLSGDDLTGAISIPNNVSFQTKQADGTKRPALVMGTDNRLYVGSNTNPTQIRSNSDPTIEVGANTYTVLHTGNHNNTGDPHNQYAKKAGDTFSGTVTLENNVRLQGKDAGGTGCNIALVDTANRVVIGSHLIPLRLHSNSDPIIQVGGADYIALHTGNAKNIGYYGKKFGRWRDLSSVINAGSSLTVSIPLGVNGYRGKLWAMGAFNDRINQVIFSKSNLDAIGMEFDDSCFMYWRSIDGQLSGTGFSTQGSVRIQDVWIDGTNLKITFYNLYTNVRTLCVDELFWEVWY